ncbi:leucyl-tRNA synthetase [Brucella melitensis]|uniref:Leucyl-tRNA synthetase n=2 Tax=Brucella TaxID=234 RepID=A0AAI8E8A5_BRUSS|nr:Leucyl-tRNA synthetase [Brucella abortus A13334]AQQ57926.1 leucyl-tRNA synthetase [Brucella melitensis]ASU73072.1 leucyl-tRNA synthetase [Brucella abortus]ATN18933.1 leucyl-tRNA synthetase [Brucella canis]ATQ53406.1 leucyl-tRNA synthetase [Brucella suis]KDV08103.1 leucyl-tRNA synthetase [Brucella suis 1330]
MGLHDDGDAAMRCWKTAHGAPCDLSDAPRTFAHRRMRAKKYEIADRSKAAPAA